MGKAMRPGKGGCNRSHPYRAQRHGDGQLLLNYTTWLNIAFLALAAVLVARFVKTGGIPMLRMMGGSPDAEHDHGHHDR
jgi:hypothetical protein